MSPNQAKKRGVVLSDTHCLGRYWKNRFSSNDVESLFKNADIAVLNGDIFDFSYSKQNDPRLWCDEAAAILKQWMEVNPSCEFHYIIGNHDNYQPLLDAFDEFPSAIRERLHLHNEEWRVGNALFLHGDYMRDEALQGANGKRRMLTEADMRQKRQDEIYSSAPQKKFIIKEHKPRLERLISLLQQTGKLKGVEHIFAGHFHYPAVNFEPAGYSGLSYHNPGSSVDGTSFNPLFFDINENNNVSHIRPALPFVLAPDISPNGR